MVANLWASWCGPCRAEFPTLQKLSARYGKKVAFLGVNTEDDDAAAKTFLAEAPLPYPSYTDPGNEIGQSLRQAAASPTPPSTAPTASSATSSRASTPRSPNSKPTFADMRSATAAKADNQVMEAFVIVAIVGFGLLLAELLLPTGGVLAGIGIAGLVAAGIVALDSSADNHDVIGAALITLGVLSAITFYFVTRKVIAAHRDAAGPRRHRGDDRAAGRGAHLDRARGPGLHRRHPVGGAAGQRRRAGRGWGIESGSRRWTG